MNYRHTGWRVALAIALGLSTGAAFAAGPLLQPSAAGFKSTDQVVNGLQSDRATISLTPMQVDSSSLAYDTDSFEIVLGAKQRVSVRRDSASFAEDGSLIWNGTVGGKSQSGDGDISDDLMNSVTLVKGGNEITGTIRINGQLYKLFPSSSGHVLAAIDESRMPPEHPAEYKSLPIENIGIEAVGGDHGSADGDAATKANTVIRVMVVVTNAAKAKIGNVTNFVNLAISETNAGYTNSGVSITMQAAGIYTTSYVESGSFSTDLARIRSTNDGILDSVHSLRTSNAADVVMFVIDNASSCGLASAIGASATTAFAAVHHGCATGYYSFGHEIGHLQSARHDPANDPTSTPYAYGHGYQYAAGGWRTIMAYACSNNCTRINYWSNPAKTRNGVPMGTTNLNHNQRVLNNTKATIAGFR
ncbi:MAG: M12 family metallo-peptidase [Lysobacterales bacterium]